MPFASEKIRVLVSHATDVLLLLLAVHLSLGESKAETNYPHPPVVAVTTNGAIQSFLMLGPMPTAGLTINNIHGERHCAPCNGQLFRAEQWSGWWRPVQSDDARHDIMRYTGDYTPSAWPPHYPDAVYLNAYLTVTVATNIVIDLSGILSDAHIFIDGVRHASNTTEFPTALSAGTHQLMIKCFGFQETNHQWNVSCRLLNEARKPTSNVSVTLNHPNDAPAELSFRNRDTFTPGEAPSDRLDIDVRTPRNIPESRIIQEDQPIPLILSVRYLNGLEMLRTYGPVRYTSWTGFRGSAKIETFDFWGRTVAETTTDITIKSLMTTSINPNFKILKRGHYTMRLTLFDEAGRRLLQRSVSNISRTREGSVPMQFAVISAERNTTPEPKSKLAASVQQPPGWPAAFDDSRLLGISHAFGARLYMTDDVSFLPTVTNGNAYIWPKEINKRVAQAQKLGMLLCGNLNSVSSEAYNDAALQSTLTRYADTIHHWQVHENSEGAKGVSIAKLQKWAPAATVISSGIVGADIKSITHHKLQTHLRTNDWLNLHTYSWGYIDEPQLVTGPVQTMLSKIDGPPALIIGRTGHDRGYPVNGVLGQTQQLSKWFVYALNQARIKKVFFSMTPAQRWTPVDADYGPYPAWLALRTLGLTLDGAEPEGAIHPSPTTHAFRFRDDNRHVVVMWHDKNAPIQITASIDVTYINMMDERFSVSANDAIPVDRLPIVLQSAKPFTISTHDADSD
ncbi:MAG: hypothetical protein ACI9OU_000458 [Candidatus Promineifilaceae bacterium]|jgi:hypothetical protein